MQMKLTQKLDYFTVFKSFPALVAAHRSSCQKPAWRGCAGSLMAEMKHNLQCGHLGCQKKLQHWI